MLVVEELIGVKILTVEHFDILLQRLDLVVQIDELLGLLLEQ